MWCLIVSISDLYPLSYFAAAVIVIAAAVAGLMLIMRPAIFARVLTSMTLYWPFGQDQTSIGPRPITH